MTNGSLRLGLNNYDRHLMKKLYWGERATQLVNANKLITYWNKNV